ncbi:polyphosphate polymerase domain-containing protein [Tamlana agarivorans]|uniref:Polyphosphate polymerase domain-containing protein n=1 Tax=Pseudotamlana agarivorans TaxID=481183 RepID=A0ACC5U6Z4_9FLAO|nr:polyphosphate polymerase domain-containing protein [Tamlana agarivorans]MBU2950083.1 polyphosphate polymerase domain-containing protein [Tamlana agarivorans]
MKQSIPDIVKSLTSISLSDMEDVALMKRTDTKFVIHENQLISVLNAVKNAYHVLEIDGKRIMRYSSLYFDTANKKFYNDHHNGKVNRTKIRMRKYVDSDICFLEIKQKDGKGSTTKTRISIDDFEQDLSENSIGFINETTNSDFNLEPIIWNNFKRITLVNKVAKERLTIDLNLVFNKSGSFKSYNNLVIIEVKQERFSRSSPVVQQLKLKQINPYSISKYCIGMLSLYNDLKYNRFKKKLIRINKITA